jgi:hypothetical protein
MTKTIETCPMHFRTPLALDKDGCATHCKICKEDISREKKENPSYVTCISNPTREDEEWFFSDLC